MLVNMLLRNALRLCCKTFAGAKVVIKNGICKYFIKKRKKSPTPFQERGMYARKEMDIYFLVSVSGRTLGR